MSATAESLALRSGNSLRPVFMLIGVAAAVAAGVAIALWSKEPSYSLLVAKVSNSQAAQIVQALEAAGIPHRVDTGSGAVLVPAERLSEARLKLAGQGLDGNDGGFSQMQKDPGFGVSQFMEGARYQHALEVELAQTIANLQPIESARVHLALPRQSAFVRDRRSGSAAVFVQLKAGKRLADEQVTSIINLVASSIPELEATRVTVVDQQGRLLSSPQGNDEYAMRDKQFEFAQRFEEIYTQRVEQLLAAIVGPGRVRAQVVADVEMALTEEAREQFRPDSQIVRSEQQGEETSRSGTGPQGVPGALTNQPPQGGTAVAPAANAATASSAPQAADNSSRQSTRNYEIDRTVAYTKQLPGKLKRISVAVLVDNAHVVAEDGTESEAPLTPEQIANMTRLVKDAVGFDEKRGDSVNVVNASFHVAPTIEQDELQSTPLWEKPLVLDIAKILGGALVLIVLMLQIIKPLLRNLMNPTVAMSAGAPLEALAALPGVAAGANAVVAAAPTAFEQQVTEARAAVQQDPQRVAQVMKSWVSTDE